MIPLEKKEKENGLDKACTGRKMKNPGVIHSRL